MHYITIECGAYECRKPSIYSSEQEAITAAIKRAEEIAKSWGASPMAAISNVSGDIPGERRIYINDADRMACIDVFALDG